MDSKKYIINKKIYFLFFTLGLVPFSATADNIPQRGSMSGELLQNNPMLNVPSAPSSKGLHELQDKSTGKQSEKKGSDKKGPEITVNHIQVINAPGSTEKDIQRFVEQYQGKKMTLGELRHIAVEITSLLQRQGERLSYAYIPRQKISDGTVTIKIMTGTLEEIRLNTNRSLVKNKSIDRYIKKIDRSKPGIRPVESQLLFISDLPGIGEMSPFLSAGHEKGGSILNLDVNASPRIEGVAVFDNAGSISSGRDRLGAQINVNSPLGFGDRLQALAYFSPDFVQINNDSQHGNTFISRVSYDAPINTNATRAGISFSRVNYKLGGPVLHGLGDGFAEISSLYASRSLIRSSGANMTLGVNIDVKRMNDKFWGESNKRSSSVLSINLSGSIPHILMGKPNIVRYQLSSTAGRLKNSDDWNGLSTQGHFYKANQNIKYQQALMPGLAFNLMFNGQQASKNLDGAEKMPLGGPYAVRAYSNAAASADSAWILSPGFSMVIPGINGITAELFYDYASGKVQKFSRRPSKVKLRGYGVGLNYDMTSKLFINGSYAWRDGQDKLLRSQNKAMGWITAGYRF